MTRYNNLADRRAYLLTNREAILAEKTAAAQELARALWSEIIELESQMRQARR